MLTFFDRTSLGRRDFLKIGGGALGGLALPGLVGSHAEAAEQGLLATGKSVVFLFLHGGPSQIETFDPKMSMPVDIRSATGELATSIPGVTFGGSFSKLATLADRMSIVRSFTTGDANHDIKPIVSRDTGGANIGALYARVAGSNHPQTGIPTNAMLFPKAVDPSTGAEILNFGNFSATGALSAGYAPFVPGAGGNLQKDMELNVPAGRLGDRRTLLDCLDHARFTLDSAARQDGLNKMRAQAFSTILGGVAGAFDLSKEDQKTIDRYDTAPLVRPDQISRAWNNYNHYVDNAKSLGKLMLLARRLCQAGCGFVTVTTSFVWDMHADVNNATMDEGMSYMAPPLDHAVSAFIEDLAALGLSDKILLVVTGEMGRTPRMNNRGGRDHWGNLAPLMLSGGGLKMGQVIGQSTRDAGEPQTEPIRIKHLLATILQTLLHVNDTRIAPGLPQDIVQALTHDAIPGLM